MEKLSLSKPFKLQTGTEIHEVTLDFEALSTADFRQIRKLEAQITDGSQLSLNQFVAGITLSDSFRVASGYLAAVRGTDGLTIDDFLRFPMKDTARMGVAAAFFWADVA